MGVQACRLPGLKPVKRLKRLQPLKRLKRVTILLARPTPQSTGTRRSSLPFASLYTLQMLKNTSWNAQPRRQKLAQGHFKIASYGRSSLPFARPKTPKTLKTP